MMTDYVGGIRGAAKGMKTVRGFMDSGVACGRRPVNDTGLDRPGSVRIDNVRLIGY
jgi:hypothetical protein